MAETLEELTDDLEAEDDAAEDESARPSANDDLGCTVEGGLVRL